MSITTQHEIGSRTWGKKLVTPLASGCLLGGLVAADALFAFLDLGLIEKVVLLPRELLIILGVGTLFPTLSGLKWLREQRPSIRFRNFLFALLAILFGTLIFRHLTGGAIFELEKTYPSYDHWARATSGMMAPLMQFFFDIAALIAVVASMVILHGIRELIFYKRRKFTARVFQLTLIFFALVFLFDLALEQRFGFFSSETDGWGHYLQNVRDGVKTLAILFVVANSFRLAWIKSISKREKWSSLGLAILCFSGAMFILVNSASTFGYVRSFGIGCGTFFDLILWFLVFYSGFAMLSLVFHLPTAKTYDRQMEEITSLHDLGRAIKSTIDLDQLVELITSHTSKVLGASACWLELWDERSSRFELVSWSGISDREAESLSEMMTASDSLSRWVTNQKRPILVHDITSHKRAAALKHWRRKAGSLVCARLLSQDQVIGILCALKDHTYGFEQEDVSALVAFADQAVMAIENARLIRASLEKERMEQELKIAREVQMRLLPMVIPQISGLEMDALSLPAYEVGGDYYDFVSLDGDRIGMTIGDVSGKGTSAAFYMAETKGILQGLGSLYEDPAALLIRVNQILYKDLDRRSFVTLLYAVIDPHASQLSVARAGHCPLYYLPRDADRGSFITPEGIGLGLEPGALFDKTICTEVIPYGPGDLFLLFSDGLIEAHRQNGEEFGLDRLDSVVQENRHRSAAEIKVALLNAVNTFKQRERLNDDLTLCIVKVLDNGGEAGDRQPTRSLPNHVSKT